MQGYSNGDPCWFVILKDKLAKNAFVVVKDMNKGCVELFPYCLFMNNEEGLMEKINCFVIKLGTIKILPTTNGSYDSI